MVSTVTNTPVVLNVYQVRTAAIAQIVNRHTKENNAFRAPDGIAQTVRDATARPNTITQSARPSIQTAEQRGIILTMFAITASLIADPENTDPLSPRDSISFVFVQVLSSVTKASAAAALP